ncbi:type II toxin-antitoxin system RelE/ParE family toxin [Desulfobacter hydrogenophilus]|uniref:Type II toxin-antitoxin system RelE/ParE family toxin n=1 Tax=Desulfobacter hydrogenophilus TaxID=2291 RepID=A0A328FC64_9BACT|nr:type II toxin-antitoxin system RelE/ParE family toxin [Desulfobacter hydrogenophilus]NDY72590.1 type II toxin-antitoxin system RelE/ParE family toxin [Desulfobacter hydrogenophilus]QBH13311.1 type II toxin-antitoxin system RelE/ParE family toxin [Desulfobacter hydrogenophilus]RAM01290.1 type II toxin-antitoxin system RelE/ParE family toxin [Desulfobacter hydrogenophilus]
MRIFQSRSFAKKVKKLNKNEKSILDDQIKSIIENPGIGDEKKGELRGIFVSKFKIKTIQYLLAYRIVDENLELILLGPHENYYRDLKKSI